jgi:4-hydroxythreonine-4-phosphate dehydrogenase
MTKLSLPKIGITMGDPTGIGPEIIVKVLSDKSTFLFCRPVVVGDRTAIERAIKLLNAPLKVHEMGKDDEFRDSSLNLLAFSDLRADEIEYGSPTKSCGKAMVRYIEEAVKLASDGRLDAITTAPINKKALSDAGYSYPGHTELLAKLTGTREYVMMLAGDKLKVALVTIHCSLKDVFHLLTTEKIVATIRITHNALRNFFGEENPKIAVAALNPHAGEEGLFGKEETEIILPAIKQVQRLGIEVEGPLPPDTLFYYAARGKYSAVVSMYHDQGLIPLKLLHFEDAVNITLGLPLIRTSVDHGTAYNIAGTGKANPLSLINALKLAAGMAMHKNIRKEN